MTVTKPLELRSERRCKAGDIEMISQSSLQTHYEIRTMNPVEMCINSDFLMNVRGRLRAGDRINIVRYENDTWQRVIEVMEGIRVIAVDNAGVELLATFAPWKTSNPGETGIVVARGWAGQFVVRVDGATYATRNTSVEANEEAQRIAEETGKPVTLFDGRKKAA